MRPGREIDTRIAKEVFGHKVWAQAKVLYESAEKGDRPLRNYSKEIEWAWEIVKKLKMTLIPIENEQWFAFVGPETIQGWASPTAVLEFLQGGKFEGCGAAIGDDMAMVICEAALRAVEKRQNEIQGAAAEAAISEVTEAQPPVLEIVPPQDTRH